MIALTFQISVVSIRNCTPIQATIEPIAHLGRVRDIIKPAVNDQNTTLNRKTTKITEKVPMETTFYNRRLIMTGKDLVQ